MALEVGRGGWGLPPSGSLSPTLLASSRLCSGQEFLPPRDRDRDRRGRAPRTAHLPTQPTDRVGRRPGSGREGFTRKEGAGAGRPFHFPWIKHPVAKQNIKEGPRAQEPQW